MIDRREELLNRLRPFGQAHLVQFWDSLSEGQRESLYCQIDQLDLELIHRLSELQGPAALSHAAMERCKSPPAIRLRNGENRFTREDARFAGEDQLRAGHVAVLLVAGGQGSRLGFRHPKGMLPIGPLSQRTLFQIHADRLRATAARYGKTIPLLLMTSPSTHDETIEYLRQEDWLQLPPDDVFVFCQGTMPAVDYQTGQILLSAPDTIVTSPDGHGGALSALAKTGLLQMFESRGIDQLFYFQVDNPLVAVADPEFLGYHALANSEMTTQVVAKQDPLERVGNVTELDGVLRIIEYSDLPESEARRRNSDGSLVFWAGSIAVHAFSVPFLQRMVLDSGALPFHRAHKRIPHIDSHGNKLSPTEPNAIKFERFIFDILPHARNALVVEVNPAEAFAPVKNESGAAADTQETAQQAMIEQHRRWLRAANASVTETCRVEIHPSFALDEDELRQKIAPGTTIDVDTYFH